MTEATEAAKTRRRWLTFAEITTVIALAIGAANFWESHREREEKRAAAAAPQKAPAKPLVLVSTIEDGGNALRLSATGADRVIQTQTIVFPAALGVGSIDTVGNPHVDAGWFASGLRKALGKERVQGRLPIGIITRYTDQGTERTDIATYDIGHGWRERILQSDAPDLEGITLIARLKTEAELQQNLDARWRQRHPDPEADAT
ncbi:hypothetical protein FHS79_001873 [Polymorphobacter multimanifer]|uniref:Uncharacterized protein n=1 Tax=Polymorphobacter multimanifer TaxID=1070431 RepID=A0A841L4Z8_9SPHN|nr:hypothetical protein [Polymorphobacter multimanifer]MBB6227694.1 hypothetical protein [Polymorphobacter multimanifer]